MKRHGSAESEFSRQRLLHGDVLTVVLLLELDRGDVPEAAAQPVVVEQCTRVQGGEPEVVDASPRSLALDHLVLVEPDQ